MTLIPSYGYAVGVGGDTMTTTYNFQSSRRMSSPERVLLMMPLNVVIGRENKGSR